jgi:PLP dependent protein
MNFQYTQIKEHLKTFPQARLLAVSKLQSPDKIMDLHKEGQRLFAENYIQELVEKMELLENQNIEWHFIGRLQKNKVKYIVGRVELIHSVDSLSLAEFLEKECEKKSVEQQKVLLQINIGQELSKGGFSPDELFLAATNLFALKRVRIEGLMCIPPEVNEPEEARLFFKRMNELRTQLQLINSRPEIHSVKELSMGMSHDYRIALEEGATLIRIGTLLFGPRPVKS